MLTTLHVSCNGDGVKTVVTIIKAFGGPSALARLLAVSPQAVTNMRARNSIPSEYWARLVQAAATREIEGITFEALAKIAEQPSKPSKRRDHAAGEAA